LAEFVAEERVFRCAKRIKQLHGDRAADAGVCADHRDEWNDAGAPADQLDGLALFRPPHEPSTEWAPELDRVTEFEVIDEEGGDFTAWQPIDAEFDVFSRASAGDGIRADSVIPVRCGESDVDVLSRIVTRPLGHGEGDAPCRGGQRVRAHEPAGVPAGGWAGHE
jgi:hypothetical protein